MQIGTKRTQSGLIFGVGQAGILKKTGDTLRGRVRGPKEVRTPSIRLGASGKHGKFLQPGPRPKTATFEPSDLAFDR